MAVSAAVTAGDTILDSQYNNLRIDALNETTGHDHDGTTDNGKKVSLTDLADLLIVDKSADETVNNSTTFQTDDHLVLAIGVSEIWLYEFEIIWESGGGSDLKVRVTVPSGATGRMSHIAEIVGGSTAVLRDQAFATGLNYEGQGVSSNFIVSKFAVYVVNSTNAGNVQLEWAQDSAVVADTKLFKGSRMTGRQIT